MRVSELFIGTFVKVCAAVYAAAAAGRKKCNAPSVKIFLRLCLRFARLDHQSVSESH